MEHIPHITLTSPDGRLIMLSYDCFDPIRELDAAISEEIAAIVDARRQQKG
jgi:hypothetical protein